MAMAFEDTWEAAGNVEFMTGRYTVAEVAASTMNVLTSIRVQHQQEYILEDGYCTCHLSLSIHLDLDKDDTMLSSRYENFRRPKLSFAHLVVSLSRISSRCAFAMQCKNLPRGVSLTHARYCTRRTSASRQRSVDFGIQALEASLLQQAPTLQLIQHRRNAKDLLRCHRGFFVPQAGQDRP